ncbi:hypothetical protein AB0I28_23365 [Phytomonospora sp. NPDC050363]|uniref:FG-GAP-like repeat-containing protein n=1 Tax=Phytomonospora sp. NPDC050363 TaxID=3155642 RepID=UPI0033E3C59B
MPFFAAAVIAASAGLVAVAQPAAAEPVNVVPDAKVVIGDIFRDLVADPLHQQVFVATYSPPTVVAIDAGGVVKQTVANLGYIMDLTISGDGSTVYALQGGDTRSIVAIDTQTYATTTVALPAVDCARTIAFTGGKLWYSYDSCADTTVGGVGVFDPATGIATTGVFTAKPGRLTALPDRPDRLFLAESGAGGVFRVYDVSGETPAEVATGGRSYCDDAVLTPDGERVLVTCGDLEIYRTSDLSREKTITTPGRSESVALSADGRFAAVSDNGSPSADSYLVHDLASSDTKVVRKFALDYYSPVTPRSVAFLGDTLVGVIRENSRESVYFKRYATKAATALTVKAPKGVRFSDRIRITGTLANGPANATVAVSRTDATGTHDLGTIPVPASGAFTFTEAPSVTGVNEYTFSSAEGEGHQPAVATASLIVRPRAFDFNNDGFAETVAGAPGENLGDDTDTGQLYILPGTRTGATGAGSRAIHQDVAGVPGSNEDGDLLGEITASGDFNGDGYADLAASLTGEDLGSAKNAGSVLVFYGSATGLTTTGVDTLSVSGEYGGFGISMAAGDFNGDGVDDLAVGEPGSYNGSAYVYRGMAGAGLSSNDRLPIYDPPGEYNENELFGYAMSAGDINGDGFDDLAVGSMYDWEVKQWSTGSVSVFYGTAYGFTSTSQFFTKDTSGVPGGSGSFNPDKGDSSDMFGAQVVLADFNGDGKADLAVGAPGSPVTGTDGKRKADAGTVTVLYSSGTKIGTTGAVQFTQDTSGLPGGAGSNDFYGSTLAAGDNNRDGFAELAIYSSGDAFVTVIPGGASGLTTSKAKAWTQDSSGIPGGSETGDHWGSSLRFLDVKGNGHLALVVGASGEDQGRGALTVIYSNAAGLTGTAAKFLSQDSDGVPGSGETGDGFGVFW